MESVDNIKEYSRQLDFLKGLEGLKVVTMSSFANSYEKVYPVIATDAKLNFAESQWSMTTDKRIDGATGEEIRYSPNIAFSDYFLADRSTFLNRKLTNPHPFDNKNLLNMPWYLLVVYLHTEKKGLIYGCQQFSFLLQIGDWLFIQDINGVGKYITVQLFLI